MRSTYLFGGSSLDNHLADTLSRIKGQIAAADSEDDLVEIEQKFRSPVARLMLDRSAASFHTSETTTGVQVAVHVPWTGDEQLVSHPADADARSACIYANIVNGRWESEGEAYVELAEDFTNPSTADVKAWAKGLLDAIEQAIASQEPLLAAHDETVRERLKVDAAARRVILANAASLREGLANGI